MGGGWAEDSRKDSHHNKSLRENTVRYGEKKIQDIISELSLVWQFTLQIVVLDVLYQYLLNDKLKDNFLVTRVITDEECISKFTL